MFVWSSLSTLHLPRKGQLMFVVIAFVISVRTHFTLVLSWSIFLFPSVISKVSCNWKWGDCALVESNQKCGWSYCMGIPAYFLELIFVPYSFI